MKLDYNQRQSVRACVEMFNERTLIHVPKNCVGCREKLTFECKLHPGCCCLCVEQAMPSKIKHLTGVGYRE